MMAELVGVDRTLESTVMDLIELAVSSKVDDDRWRWVSGGP